MERLQVFKNEFIQKFILMPNFEQEGRVGKCS